MLAAAHCRNSMLTRPPAPHAVLSTSIDASHLDQAAAGNSYMGTLRRALMTEGTAPARPASYDKKVGLVLQGGGALGSYQAGVYEALASSEYMPDWVAGI